MLLVSSLSSLFFSSHSILGLILFVPDARIVPYAADLVDGTLVTHTGTVDNSLITKTGGHLILNVSGVDIFVPGGAV